MMYKPLMRYATKFHRNVFMVIMDLVKQLETRLVLIITLPATIKSGEIKFNEPFILKLHVLFRPFSFRWMLGCGCI